ncbi:amidohydrolase [Moritella viscosa]|uniref:amidohydrolase n=1 Tax=Moritella viscosa TaxID=80854 RepID=UPI000914D553|nr:amidohydrolase [Moritella viscosa]SGY87449.1 Predicted metal-dependent hydrolase with the TIM-barrel fold [Moritella viscosa]
MIKFRAIRLKRSTLSFFISTMLISPITIAGNTFFHNKDVLFYNGNIITMKTSPDGDLLNENAGALCIIKGKIASVGSDVKSLGRHCRYLPKNKKVNLGGKTLVPGFIDSHSHFLIHGLYKPFADLQSPPLGDVVKIGNEPSALDDESTLLGSMSSQSEKWTGWSSRDWIMGNGYDDTLLEGKEHPTTKQLDLIDRAVYVTHTSSHMGSANTKALKKVGIYGVDKDGYILNKDLAKIMDDSSVAICCGGQGKAIGGESYEPTGVLKEGAHAYALTKVASHIPMEQVLLGLLSVGERYLSVGVTTAQDGLTPKAAYSGRLLKIIQAISKTPRLVILPDQESAEAIGDFNSPNFLPKETDYFKVGGVKLVLDGSIQGYTGYLSDHYYSIKPTDCPDPKDHCKNWRGEAQIEDEKLNLLVQKLLKNNWQIYAHVNGDAAMEQYLVAIETAISTGVISKEEVRARRLVAIHAQVTTPRQMDRLKDLGMIPSFFTEHVYYWGLRHKNTFLGNPRAQNISATGWAKDINLPFTLHSDAPIVPIDPMHIMETAVKREMCDTDTVKVKGGCTTLSDPLGSEHKLTWDEALMANTVTAAYQYGEEGTRGSLEVGKFGDVVVLSADPRFSDDTPTVLQTYVGGKLLFEKDDDKDNSEKALSVLRKVIKSGAHSDVRSLIPDHLHSKGLETLAAMKNDDIQFLIQNLPLLEKLYFQHGGH